MIYSQLLLIIVFACVSFMHCSTSGKPDPQLMDSIYLSYNHELVPYSFYDPDTAYQLDMMLQEISALAYISENEFAVVEDEHGKVFVLSPEGAIIRELEFGEDADYEGLEYADGRFFVLQSNGDLTIFQADSLTSSKTLDTELKNKNDAEGLGLWQGALLVACKGDGEAGDYKPSGKAVYTMDMATGELLDLVVDVKEKDMEAIIQKRHPELDVTEFDPSAIAVNPVDNTIYLLSADMLIAIFSQGGELQEVVPLFAMMYRQPEGMVFTPDGTLYIGSEGAGQAGQLFRLSRKK